MNAIDIHAHWYPESCLVEATRDNPDFAVIAAPDGRSAVTRHGGHAMSVPAGADDLPKRLAMMDDLGVELQVLSIGVLDVTWAGDRAATLSRRINDALAALCRDYPARFRFVAALPLEREREMRDELDRALSLGAAGVGITTTPAGRLMDAPELRPFWREASARNLLVLVHPTFPPNGPAGDQGQFLCTGYLGETAFAATRLVLGGVLEECPGIRLVWSHLGGGLAMAMDRLDRGYQRYGTCRRPPSAYLRECYFDTVSTHAPAIECARATFGTNALVFGADEPHVPNATRDILAALRAQGWPAAELEAVLAGSARRLLGLPA